MYSLVPVLWLVHVEDDMYCTVCYLFYGWYKLEMICTVKFVTGTCKKGHILYSLVSVLWLVQNGDDMYCTVKFLLSG